MKILFAHRIKPIVCATSSLPMQDLQEREPETSKADILTIEVPLLLVLHEGNHFLQMVVEKIENNGHSITSNSQMRSGVAFSGLIKGT